MSNQSVKELIQKGNTLYRQGKKEKALSTLRKALKSDQGNPALISNTAVLEQELGHKDRAETLLRQGLEKSPESSILLFNLGELYLNSGDYKDALPLLNLAADTEAENTLFLNRSGKVKALTGDKKGALKSYLKSFKINPASEETCYAAGNLLREMKEIDKASFFLKQAININPESYQILNNLGEVEMIQGNLKTAGKHLLKAGTIIEGNPVIISNILMNSLYRKDMEYTEVFSLHKKSAAQLEKRYDAFHISPSLPRRADKRIKVAYLSADFNRHPAGSFIFPLVKYHNPEEFEVICYSNTEKEDERTEKFKEYTGIWRGIRKLNVKELTQRIQTDSPDILCDCSGYTEGFRPEALFSKGNITRVSMIGYPETTGSSRINYRITDRILTPEGYQDFFTEKLLDTQTCFCSYEPPAPYQLQPAPSAEKGFVRFGSLHKPERLNPHVISVWAEILKRVEDSRILFLRDTLSDSIEKRIRGIFNSYGIGSHRTEFSRKIPAAGHLHAYNSIDITLDTFPWSGHTTVCESLLCGTPVITLLGKRASSRMGASIVRHAGMEKSVAEAENDYIDKAVSCASNIRELRGKRTKDMFLSSVVCNGRHYTRAVEKVYKGIVT